MPILMVLPSVHRFGVGGAVPLLAGLAAPFPLRVPERDSEEEERRDTGREQHVPR